MADPILLQARLRAKVVADLAGCWIWQGATESTLIVPGTYREAGHER